MTADNENNRELDTTEVVYRERKRIMFFGLPWTFVVYSMTKDVVVVNRGLLRTTEDNCYMYKIQDVKLTRSLFERLFGLGTVICYTGDVTTPELVLVHIKKSKEIKDYILKASEQARLRRRTLHTLDIGGATDEMELDNL